MKRRYIDPNPEPTAEQIVAQHEAMWRNMGGIGDPPPLFVSRDLYRHAIKVGFPAERMTIAR